MIWKKSNELYSLLTLCIPFALLSYRVLRNYIKEILFFGDLHCVGVIRIGTYPTHTFHTLTVRWQFVSGIICSQEFVTLPQGYLSDDEAVKHEITAKSKKN